MPQTQMAKTYILENCKTVQLNCFISKNFTRKLCMFIHPTFVTEAGYGEMTINQPFRKCWVIQHWFFGSWSLFPNSVFSATRQLSTTKKKSYSCILKVSSGLRKLKNDTYTSTMVKATNSVNVPSRTQNKCLAACTADFFVREK